MTFRKSLPIMCVFFSFFLRNLLTGTRNIRTNTRTEGKKTLPQQVVVEEQVFNIGIFCSNSLTSFLRNQYRTRFCRIPTLKIFSSILSKLWSVLYPRAVYRRFLPFIDSSHFYTKWNLRTKYQLNRVKTAWSPKNRAPFNPVPSSLSLNHHKLV